MTDELAHREACAAQIRETVGNDPFLLKFALLYAMECLDLRRVNDLADAVISTAYSPEFQRAQRVEALEEERLRPSRLS